MKYNWILFDADNTLFDFNKSAHEALEKTFSDFSIPFTNHHIDEYHEVNHQCWLAFEQGKMDAVKLRSERFRLFLDKIGIDINAQKMGHQYLDHLANCPYLLDGAIPLLERLHGKVKMAIVTNGLKEVQRQRFKLTNIYRYFEEVVISDEIGVSKPNPAFFDFTFQQIGVPQKEEALMVGDSLSSDITGGHNYGLATCWYNPQRKDNTSGIQPTYECYNLDEFEQTIQ